MITIMLPSLTLINNTLRWTISYSIWAFISKYHDRLKKQHYRNQRQDHNSRLFPFHAWPQLIWYFLFLFFFPQFSKLFRCHVISNVIQDYDFLFHSYKNNLNVKQWWFRTRSTKMWSDEFTLVYDFRKSKCAAVI